MLRLRPMTRNRRRQKDPMDLVMFLVGAATLAFLFIPAFRQALEAFFYLAIIVGLVVLAGFIGWKIFWRKHADPGALRSSVADSARPVVHPEQPPITQVANGQVNLEDDANSRFLDHSWSLKLLGKLEWKRFENVVAAY